MTSGAGGAFVGTVIEPLREAHTSVGFQCRREPEIERFFCESAWAHERQGYSRTHVLVAGSSGLPPVAGFYSICSARLGTTDVATISAATAPGQLPVILLAQLGRDDRTAGGTGTYLMADMFRKVLKASEIIGACGIAVDAKNDGLVEYYRRFGFEPTKRRQLPQKMFLEMGAIRAAAGR